MEHRTLTDRQRALVWLAEQLHWEKMLAAMRTDRSNAPQQERRQAA
jgi:hypothetical protein